MGRHCSKSGLRESWESKKSSTLKDNFRHQEYRGCLKMKERGMKGGGVEKAGGGSGRMVGEKE